MAEAFGLAVSILGIVGLATQVGELLAKFGMSWSHASKDVKSLTIEIQALKTILSATYVNAIENPEFEKAMTGKEFALLMRAAGPDEVLQ
ncbi:hypothetical protein F5Y16DRAFT_355071 [Xylariaceae sp. FL0255]|nr:hypothetical protein F5Y16DRAFT_355071 [Xylariaceae sp. FL0255]